MRWLLLAALVAGGPTVPREQLLGSLREAMETPVSSAEDAAHHSRVTMDAVEGDALYGMRRHEVQDVLGRGDPCSRHPQCAEHGFEGDDWFYLVGQMGESGYGGPVPVLIVGFDHHGQATRVWYQRTHE